jgi:hypothetical protein
MAGSYEEFGSIKPATLKRETLADAEQSVYLKFVRPNRGGYPIPRHPQPPRLEKPTLRQH